MITLFAIPRSFNGHIGLIQRNAIASWTRLRPLPDIILFGDEPGVEETAAEYHVRHERVISRNASGTPLISDVFTKAASLGTHELQCYVNADIILLSDFPEAVRCVDERWRSFLLVGRRWDLDITDRITFEAEWESALRRMVGSSGRLHAETGIDYFVFRRGLWGEIPPFAVGRTVWDNWLVYRARARRAPVVDATGAITAVHQNHDYPEFPGVGAWNGPEAERNLQLAGGYGRAYSLSDSTWQLTRNRLVPAVRNYPHRLWMFPRRIAHRLLWGLKRGTAHDDASSTTGDSR